ncbi:30S ribosomal protein S18 [Candidatus Vidania fulgoroideae]|nr:30S ribosomal protein S18 [Candidatus Vidania fulgoroideae]
MIYPNNIFYYSSFVDENFMIKKRDRNSFSFFVHKKISKFIKISRILGLIPFCYNKSIKKYEKKK